MDGLLVEFERFAESVERIEVEGEAADGDEVSVLGVEAVPGYLCPVFGMGFSVE